MDKLKVVSVDAFILEFLAPGTCWRHLVALPEL
jgi:hypothetical protein